MLKYFFYISLSLLFYNSSLAQDVNIQENINLSFACELDKKIIKNSKYNYQTFLAKDLNEKGLDNLKIESLRSKISLVSQDITLFDDTIKNNIKYSKLDASEEEIIEAAKLSFCDEFVNILPNKYETLIGENGVRLSGGEKQRLSIARAMLK